MKFVTVVVWGVIVFVVYEALRSFYGNAVPGFSTTANPQVGAALQAEQNAIASATNYATSAQLAGQPVPETLAPFLATPATSEDPEVDPIQGIGLNTLGSF